MILSICNSKVYICILVNLIQYRRKLPGIFDQHFMECCVSTDESLSDRLCIDGIYAPCTQEKEPTSYHEGLK